MKSFRIYGSLVLLLGAAGLWVWLHSGQRNPLALEQTSSALSKETVLSPKSPRKHRRDLSHLPVPIAEFDRWSQRYLEANAGDQDALRREGVKLAEVHRATMKSLIQTNPRLAIESAVPMVVRQELPTEIVARLEERVHDIADVEVLAVSEDSAPTESRVRRFTRIGDKEYRTFVYGRREEQNSLSQVAVNGVAVDQVLALSESPLRLLEIGEVPPPGSERVEQCPVSGKTTPVEEPTAPVEEDTAAVEVGRQIVYLCEGGHIRLYEEELIAGEGGTGGTTGITSAAATSFSNGPRTLLYMRLAYPDDLLEPQTEAAAWEAVRGLNSYFQEVSYGKIYYLAAVPPLVVLPKTKAWYVQDYLNTDSNSPIMNDAKEAARRMGYNPDNFQHYTVIYSSGPGSFGGLGSVGGPNVWLKTTSLGTFVHEIGHNVGLWHGNSWNTNNRDVIGGGGNGEYGNSYDVLGSSGSVTGNKGHFMSPHKNQMNWLSNSYVSTATTNGLYRIFPMDQTVLDPTRSYALKIPKDADRDYWVEFRQKYNADHRWFRDGVVLNWSAWGQNLDTSLVGSNRGGQFLDTTPGSADGKNDGPVVIGRTFSDRESGVHITPVAKGGTTPESMDVMVQVGDFPSNRVPVIQSLTADTLTPALNGSVNFTVDATDEDGDALAYFWDFGDATYGTNSATTTKQFTTTRHHAVRCIVSDMKGGEVSKLMLITVGSPTTLRVSGRVVDDSGNPLAEVRIQNGSTGTGFRGGWTDSNGDYVVTNLTAGNVTLTPVMGGYSFSPASSAIALSSNMSAVNFTAAETVRLSVEAIDATADETGSNGGSFRLTRTGSTSAALTVYADLQGDASTVDYTLTPVADAVTVSPIEVFSIPAGASTLDIAVTSVADATREGPEALRLVLIPHSAYTIAGKAFSEVIITDTGSNNTPNRVTVVAMDENADESGEAGAFEIRRTGVTTDPLNVVVAMAGVGGTQAATNGSDYALISSPVTIPAGESYVLVPVTPIQDELVEGQETVQLTITANTAYGVGTPSSANVRLADDDIPTVTISATDATATEGSTDTGLFTVTRTGDASAPLVVDYIIGGSALHGTDYLALPGTLTIPAGAASAAILITPVDDALGEAAQTVLLQLRNDPRFLLGTSNSAQVTLVDNDLPVVAIGISDSSCNEPNANGGFRITTTGTGAGNITVRYTVSGTATSGTDFVALTGTLVMAKNTTSTITLTPIEDALIEDAESVTLTLTPDASYSVDVLQAVATLNIRDNDSAQTVNVSFTTATMNENGGTSKLFFSRTNSTGSAVTTGALTINYSLSGTATAGLDYTALTGTAVIPDLASNVSVDVTGINDSTAEGAESVNVTIESGSYSVETGVAQLTISDDDSGLARTASFATRRSVKSEGDSAFTIPVMLSAADPVNPVVVDYIIDTNSATGSGVDTDLVAGSITFAPGTTQKDIAVAVIDDLLPEFEEHVTLKLSFAYGASLTNNGSFHTLFIRDNEPRVTLALGNAFAYEQSGDEASFVLTRTGSVAGPLVVNLMADGTATSGVDYTGMSGTLTFAPGERRLTCEVRAISDGLVEGVETLQVSLLPSSKYSIAGAESVTLTVLDSGGNHPPSVRITKPVRSEIALPTGCGLILAAEVSDDQPISESTVLWTRVSGAGTVTFGNSGLAETTALFSAAGRYVLRCTVTDASLLSSFAEVIVTVNPGANIWLGQDIGITGTAVTGTEDVRGDFIQNQSAGSSLTGTSDVFHFTHTGLNGAGDIVGRFEGVDGAFGSFRSGVMIRESTAANSRSAVLTFSGNSALTFTTRSTAGGAASSSTNLTVPPGPRWLRVTRAANVFSAHHSTDAVNWTQVGANTTLAMASTTRAGIASISGSATRPARALFSQVRVSGAATNTGPIADAAPTSTLTSAATKQLTGSINDDEATGDPVTSAWSLISGPGSVAFADASAAVTTVTFSTEGNHVLRLTATDGEVTSFEDVTVQVAYPNISFTVSGTAQEEGGISAQVTLARTGAVDMPLALNYSIAGSASAADYDALSGTTMFEANASTAALQVTPLSDSLAEGDEEVTVTLQPSSIYRLSAQPSASILIKDRPIDAWRVARFGASANTPAIAGDLMDPDQNGLENLLEYALSYGSAGAGTQALPPQPGGVCQLIYTRPVTSTDVTYHVEWSTTLTGWSTAGVTHQVLSTTGGVQTVRASVTLPTETRAFMKLRVTRP